MPIHRSLTYDLLPTCNVVIILRPLALTNASALGARTSNQPHAERVEDLSKNRREYLRKTSIDLAVAGMAGILAMRQRAAFR